MATKYAPTYANNFVGMFQENYVCHLIYENSKLFSRYSYISYMDRNPNWIK